jgi:hypothetical protein
VTWILTLLLFADLSSIKGVPDLEKRSELALANADEQVDAARTAYKAGDVKKMQQALDELRDSVTLAADALENAPKQARKSKYYKRAELKTRALLRRLKTLADEVSVDDRTPVEDARQKVQEVHDHLLEDIMSNKK